LTKQRTKKTLIISMLLTTTTANNRPALQGRRMFAFEHVAYNREQGSV